MTVNLVQGERSKADELWRSQREAAKRTKFPTALVTTEIGDCTRLFLDGLLEESLDAAAKAVSIAEESGASVPGLFFASQAAIWPLLYLGRPAEALSYFRQVAEAALGAETTNSKGREALCYAYQGRVKEAEVLLREMT